jgi:hypothetical protein
MRLTSWVAHSRLSEWAPAAVASAHQHAVVPVDAGRVWCNRDTIAPPARRCFAVLAPRLKPSARGLLVDADVPDKVLSIAPDATGGLGNAVASSPGRRSAM